MRAGRAHDEQGLIGKIAILWLVLLALFIVAAIDTGSILYTRYKVADAADSASFEAASVYKDTHDQRAALAAALAKVEEVDPGARIPSKSGFVVNTQTGEVTVTVAKKSWTLLAGRIGFTQHYVKASATQTNGPPVL
jgi:uncharacterized membrane protein